MAIDVGTLIEVSLKQRAHSMNIYNVWQYEVNVFAPGTTALQLGEAWWNHVKTVYRAYVGSTWGSVFRSVYIKELNNPTGEYAEFPIPGGEQAGTRIPPTQGEALPLYCAIGVKLTVATRATRPGQKRFTYFFEGDQNTGTVDTPYMNNITTLMNVMSNPMVLGIPALATELVPIVVKKTPTGTVTAHQTIEGFLSNPTITTQTTRRYGRGE